MRLQTMGARRVALFTNRTKWGSAEAQEMLDLCAKKGMACAIEVIPMSGINEAYEPMLKSEVRYRGWLSIWRASMAKCARSTILTKSARSCPRRSKASSKVAEQ